MQTKNTYYWTTAVLALALTACASEPMEGDTEVGRLELPLATTGSNGSAFVLDGEIRLEGPETIVVDLSEQDPAGVEPVLVLNPRVGSYTLSLVNWTLQQLVAGNTPPLTPVAGAVLVSAATQSISIANNTTTYVTYEFSVPGTGTVVFARGTLNIDFDVEQGFPAGAACTTAVECASQVCRADYTCAAASCSDGVQNGSETSPDCGPECMCGGGAQACTAAQAAVCAATDTCTVVAGVVQCMAGGFPPAGTICGAAEAGMCPAGSTTCVADGSGGIVCSSGGVGAMCDPAQTPPGCPAGLSCVGTAATGYTCQSTALPTGSACTSNGQCASGVCFAATSTCG